MTDQKKATGITGWKPVPRSQVSHSGTGFQPVAAVGFTFRPTNEARTTSVWDEQVRRPVIPSGVCGAEESRTPLRRVTSDAALLRVHNGQPLADIVCRGDE